MLVRSAYALRLHAAAPSLPSRARVSPIHALTHVCTHARTYTHTHTHARSRTCAGVGRAVRRLHASAARCAEVRPTRFRFHLATHAARGSRSLPVTRSLSLSFSLAPLPFNPYSLFSPCAPFPRPASLLSRTTLFPSIAHQYMRCALTFFARAGGEASCASACGRSAASATASQAWRPCGR